MKNLSPATASEEGLADKLLSSLELELKCLSARPRDPVRGQRITFPYGIDGKTVSSANGRTV